MPAAAFEPTIRALERPQTHALDRAATGTGDDAVQFHVNLPILRTEVAELKLDIPAVFSSSAIAARPSHLAFREQ